MVGRVLVAPLPVCLTYLILSLVSSRDFDLSEWTKASLVSRIEAQYRTSMIFP